MTKAVEDLIRGIAAPEHILTAEPMAKHTTFRVGGPADLFVRVQSEEELAGLTAGLFEAGQPYLVLGNGSNLLVSDSGYRGVVLLLGEPLSMIRTEGTKMTVQAGALLSRTASQAAKASLSGLEFAAGIPGSLGGAIVMNAGAYDGEMSQIVESVTVLDERGRRQVLSCAEMEFAYRTSLIKRKPYTVVSAVLSLKEGNRDGILAKMEELARLRREKQPLEYASAGSTFKRPQGYFAGKLIMDAGLKGLRIGGAQVSEKHCGFVINTGGATASEIHALMKEIQRKVKEQFQVELEPEVIRIGEFS